MVETTSNHFAYCGVLIERVDNQSYIKGNAFGVVAKNYSTWIYDRIFNLSNDTRKIMTVCTLEVITIKPLKFMSIILAL
jgi:hypothetical protein